MTSTKYYLVVVLMILIGEYNSSIAQQKNNLKFQHLSEGLSQNMISAIMQDKKGFMWFGTWSGLNKYDGTNISIYENNRLDSTSLGHSRIQCLFQDSKKRIWIGTFGGGLNLYNPDNDNFIRFTNSISDPQSISGNIVNDIFEDSKGNLWLATVGGLSQFIEEENKFKNYTYSNDEENYLRCINEDTNGNLLIGTGNGLYLFNKNEEFFQKYSPKKNDKESITGFDIRAIKIDLKGRIWIGTWDGGLSLICYSKDGEIYFKNYKHNPNNPNSLGHNNILSLLTDTKGNLWIGTENGGLNRFHPDTEIFDYYFPDDKDKHSLNGRAIWSLFEDKAGRIWIGSFNHGLNVIDMYYSKFQHYEAMDKALNSPVIWDIAENNEGNLWIATDGGGLNFWNRKTNSFDNYIHQAGNKNSLSGNNVLSAFVDFQGNVWAGTWGGGLNKFNPQKKKFTRFLNQKGNSSSLSSNFVFDVIEDKFHPKNLFVSSWEHGISYYNHKANSFKNYIGGHPDNKDENTLSNYLIFELIQTSDGSIWAATLFGLNRIFYSGNLNDITVSQYLNDKSDINSISDNIIQTLFEDSKKRLWIGTSNGGLCLYRKDKNDFISFDTKDGLPGNTVVGILEDDNGNLWVSTTKGLAKVILGETNDELSIKCKVFDKYDGIQASEFKQGACLKTSDKKLVFGGINGFNIFHPDSIRLNPFAPTLVFTDFKLFYRSVKAGDENSPLTNHINETKSLTLTHNDEIISFEFSGVNLTHADKNEYAYILEGFDKNWNYIGNAQTITFTSLAGGEYTLKVKAANHDGIWSKKNAEIKLIILPPWWETTWFRILAILTLLSIAVTIYKIRTYQLKQKQIELERQVTERTLDLKEANIELSEQKDEIQSQADELHSQKEELEQQRDYLELANNTISKQLEDIRILSVIGQKVTGSMELKNLIKTVYYNVNQLVNAPNFEIGILDRSEKGILYLGYHDINSELKESYSNLNESGRLTSISISNNQEIIIQNVEEEITNYVNKKAAVRYLNAPSKSILYIPLHIENKAIGVLVIKSPKKNAYSEVQIELVRNLTAYVSIAIANAKAYEAINNKNELITQSINYAKQIQEAILPNINEMKERFSDLFVIFRPKDIVSGDFYWYSHLKKENITFIAVVDCTGHGVPGAFMSMIGSSLLNRIVYEERILDPGAILDKLNKYVWKALRQEETNNQDGMDICLCAVEQIYNQFHIKYSGAKNDLYYAKKEDGELNQVKSTRKGIGGKAPEKDVFKTQELILRKGDSFYLTTDGYIDQSNTERKRFGSAKLRQVLKNNLNQSFGEQKSILELALDNHKGKSNQRDDISFVGIEC